MNLICHGFLSPTAIYSHLDCLQSFHTFPLQMFLQLPQICVSTYSISDGASSTNCLHLCCLLVARNKTSAASPIYICTYMQHNVAHIGNKNKCIFYSISHSNVQHNFLTMFLLFHALSHVADTRFAFRLASVHFTAAHFPFHSLAFKFDFPNLALLLSSPIDAVTILSAYLSHEHICRHFLFCTFLPLQRFPCETCVVATLKLVAASDTHVTCRTK